MSAYAIQKFSKLFAIFRHELVPDSFAMEYLAEVIDQGLNPVWIQEWQDAGDTFPWQHPPPRCPRTNLRRVGRAKRTGGRATGEGRGRARRGGLRKKRAGDIGTDLWASAARAHALDL